jgi:hypothetical protein
MVMADRPKLAKFVTGIDVKSSQAAMLMALAAIDAGAFSKRSENRRRRRELASLLCDADSSQFKDFPTKFVLRNFRTKFVSTGRINHIAAARE